MRCGARVTSFFCRDGSRLDRAKRDENDGVAGSNAEGTFTSRIHALAVVTVVTVLFDPFQLCLWRLLTSYASRAEAADPSSVFAADRQLGSEVQHHQQMQ